MNGASIVMWIGVGALAGLLASISGKPDRSQDPLEDIAIGVVGGFIGGMALDVLALSGGVIGFNVMSVLTAIIGSAALIAVLHTFRRA